MPAITTVVVYRIEIPDLVNAVRGIMVGSCACVFIACIYLVDIFKPKPNPKSVLKNEAKEKES